MFDRDATSSKGSVDEWLARYAVAEVYDSGAEGAGLEEFEIRPAPALGKERYATANQHWVDPGPVLVDQAQRGRRGGESRAADRDVALPRLRSQPLDPLRQAARGQRRQIRRPEPYDRADPAPVIKVRLGLPRFSSPL
jgi:hypothetical protein